MDGSRVEGRGDKNSDEMRFVKSVRVGRETRVGWKQAVLGVFWFLILLKCFLAHWAVSYWEMPIESIWVWAPTLFAAVVCTIVFLAGGGEE